MGFDVSNAFLVSECPLLGERPWNSRHAKYVVELKWT